jgi:hypothetical protein
MRDIVFILTIIALSFLLYKECNKEPIVIEGEPYEVLKVVRDTDYVPFKVLLPQDTLIKDTTIYVDVPYLDSIKMDSIVREYYAKVVYIDTVAVDKFGHLYLTDTISHNTITNRSLMADLTFPIYRDTIFLGQPSPKGLYLGSRMDLTERGIFLGPSVMYIQKNKIYSGGFSLGGGKPFYSVGLNIKL